MPNLCYRGAADAVPPHASASIATFATTAVANTNATTRFLGPPFHWCVRRWSRARAEHVLYHNSVMLIIGERLTANHCLSLQVSSGHHRCRCPRQCPRPHFRKQPPLRADESERGLIGRWFVNLAILALLAWAGLLLVWAVAVLCAVREPEDAGATWLVVDCTVDCTCRL